MARSVPGHWIFDLIVDRWISFLVSFVITLPSFGFSPELSSSPSSRILRRLVHPLSSSLGKNSHSLLPRTIQARRSPLPSLRHCSRSRPRVRLPHGGNLCPPPSRPPRRSVCLLLSVSLGVKSETAPNLQLPHIFLVNTGHRNGTSFSIYCYTVENSHRHLVSGETLGGLSLSCGSKFKLRWVILQIPGRLCFDEILAKSRVPISDEEIRQK